MKPRIEAARILAGPATRAWRPIHFSGTNRARQFTAADCEAERNGRSEKTQLGSANRTSTVRRNGVITWAQLVADQHRIRVVEHGAAPELSTMTRVIYPHRDAFTQCVWEELQRRDFRPVPGGRYFGQQTCGAPGNCFGPTRHRVGWKREPSRARPKSRTICRINCRSRG